MPVKESTIRLKLVGARDVSTGLRALSKEFGSEMAGLRRALKIEDTDGITKFVKRYKDTSKAVDDVRGKSTYDIQRDAIDRQLEFSKKYVAKNRKVLEKAGIDELEMLTALAEQAERDKAKITEREMKPINAAKEKQRKKEEHEEKKKIEREAKEKKKAQEEYFKDTVDFNKYVSSERQKEEVQKKKQAEREAKEKKKGEKESGAGFGGKMILGGAAGQMIHAATGSGEAGSMAGTMAAGFMFGGGGIGSLTSGLLIAGIALEGWRNKVKATTEASVEFSKSLSDIATTWSRLSTSMVERNPFGKAMENEFHRASDAAEKTRDQIISMLMEGDSLSDKFINFIGGKSAYEVRLEQLQKEASLQDVVSAKAKRFRDSEYPRQIRNEESLIRLQRENVKTASIQSNVERERQQLAISREKELMLMDNEYEIKMRQHEASKETAQTAIAMQREEVKRLEALTKENVKTFVHPETGMVYETGRNDPVTQAANTKALAAAQDKLTKSQKEYDDEVAAGVKTDRQRAIDQQNRIVRINKENEDLKRLHKTQRDQELRLVNSGSAIAVENIRRQELSGIGMSQRDIDRTLSSDYILKNEQKELDIKYASGKLDREAYEYKKIRASDKTIVDFSSKDLEARRLAENIAKEEMDTQKMQFQIAKEAAELQTKYLTGQMTRLEMEKEIAVAQNPTARRDKEFAETVRKSVEPAHNAALKQKFMSPLEQLKNESKDIMEAFDKGFITKERARHLLQVGVNQTQNLPTGQFGTMSSRWQEIQGAALKPEDDTMKLMYEEFKGIRDLIESFRNSGFPIKG